MDEGPIARPDDAAYSRARAVNDPSRGELVMKRFLAVMFSVALSAALTAPATADTAGQKVDRAVQKTKDAAEKVGDKAKDVKDRMLGRKSEGPRIITAP
jgi:predicted small secreted protein